MGPELDTSVYPGSDQQDMDRENYGIGGMTAMRLLDEMPAALAGMAAPDVTLIGIGGNDMKPPRNRPGLDVALDIAEIVDLLQTANPDMMIFVELIAPGRSDIMGPELQERLDDLTAALGALPALMSTSRSKVVLIDMQRGWSDALVADATHYNEAGAAMVAHRYFDALTAEFGPGGEGTLGERYCVSTPNSTGNAATITATGRLSVAANDLTLGLAYLPAQRPAAFITSRVQGFVPGLGDASNGNLCLAGQIDRFVAPGQIVFADLHGRAALTLDLASFPDGAATSAVLTGETRFFQAWYRDAAGVGSNLTGGLELTFVD